MYRQAHVWPISGVGFPISYPWRGGCRDSLSSALQCQNNWLPFLPNHALWLGESPILNPVVLNQSVTPVILPPAHHPYMHTYIMYSRRIVWDLWFIMMQITLVPHGLLNIINRIVFLNSSWIALLHAWGIFQIMQENRRIRIPHPNSMRRTRMIWKRTVIYSDILFVVQEMWTPQPGLPRSYSWTSLNSWVKICTFK
jgi:hypothetical protein